jgi:hypothetical protein
MTAIFLDDTSYQFLSMGNVYIDIHRNSGTRHPVLNTVRNACGPTWATGTHNYSNLSYILYLSTTGARGARAPRLAIGFHPDSRNRLAQPFPSLYCICIFQVFQTFQIYVAIASSWCCKSKSGDVAYAASVSETRCKRLFKMLHMFQDVCCNCFLSGCCICFTHMLQRYLPNISVVSVLCCNK